MLLEVPHLETDFHLALTADERLSDTGDNGAEGVDGILSLFETGDIELVDLMCEEICDLEGVLCGCGNWGLVTELLTRIYLEREDLDLVPFLRVVMLRFRSGTPGEQRDIGEFLLECDAGRFEVIALEFSRFVVGVLCDDSIEDMVRVRFLKLFMRLCDRSELTVFAGSESDGADFFGAMYALAGDEDDDELNAYMAEVADLLV